jgi:endonuclease YncB( thermonuclease family)
VVVDPDPTAAQRSASSFSAGSAYNGSRLVLTSALPNPDGTDTGHEWLELRNLEDHPVDLSMWKIGAGETSIQRYSLKGMIEPRARLKIYNSELKFTLANSDSKLRLYDPLGSERSSVDWPKAEEDRVYYSNDLTRLESVHAKVIDVIDPVTLLLSISGQEAELLGEDVVTLKLLGVTAPDPLNYPEITFRSTEFLRALLKDKNCELEFDTNVWTSDGNLEAYVTTEDSLSPAKELLLQGFVLTDETLEFSKQNEFADFQSSAKEKKLGLWNISNFLTDKFIYGALEKDKKSDSTPSKKSPNKTTSKTLKKKVSSAQKVISGFASLYRADLAREDGTFAPDSLSSSYESQKTSFFSYLLCFLLSVISSTFLQKILDKKH